MVRGAEGVVQRGGRRKVGHGQAGGVERFLLDALVPDAEERLGLRAERSALGQDVGEAVGGRPLALDGDGHAALGEGAKDGGVGPVRHGLGAEVSHRAGGLRGEETDADAHPQGRHRRHPPELAAAEDAEGRECVGHRRGYGVG